MRLLDFLAKNDCTIMGVNYLAHGDNFSSHCEVSIEYNAREASVLKEILSQRYQERLVSFLSAKDAYQA